MSELSEWIKQAREQMGISQREMCTVLGISSSAVSQIEAGSMKPGSEIVIKFAEVYPQFSRDWLLTGEGPMLRAEQADQSRELETLRAAVRALKLDLSTLNQRLEAIRRVAILELLTQEGLGNVALMAGGTSQDQAFHILEVLSEVQPEPISLQCLLERLEANGKRIEDRAALAQLTSLQTLGTVECLSDGRYVLKRPLSRLTARSPAEHSSKILQILKTLIETMMPACLRDDGSGVMMLVHGTIPKGVSAAEFIQQFRAYIVERCNKAGEAEPGETFSIVFAGALDKSKVSC